MRAFDFYNNIIPVGINEFFPRAYYLLGWNNEQFAVYYGAEYDAATQLINCVGGGTANITSSGPRTVLMWNAEYNTYGNGSNINLTYKYNSDGTWKKYYNINDHLGNVRTVLRKEINPPATILKQFDYAPFGKVLCSSSNCENRTKFIGKEKDKESNYADHGVRKYDDEIGRFTSIDPLWEKYYSLTPYQYAGNNPVSFLDPKGGEVVTATAGTAAGLYIGGVVAIGAIGWLYTEATNPGATESFFDAVANSFNKAVDNVKDVYNKVTGKDEAQAKSKGSNSEAGNTGTPPPPSLNNDNKNNSKTNSLNQISKKIEKGQAPKSIDRLDVGKGSTEKPHIHITGKGNHALNIDGSWKHGGRALTNKEVEFLKSIGWGLPK